VLIRVYSWFPLCSLSCEIFGSRTPKPAAIVGAVDNLVEQVQRRLLPPGPVRKGEKLLVAVSGGVDSIVLLHVLAQLAPANRWKLSVAHLNHKLRGASSNADERLVQRTAKTLKLPVFIRRTNVRGLAKQEGISLEMAARKARHEFLAQLAAHQRIPFIVLAHHADDQVELFFLRLLRGAGAQGLSGMRFASASPANPKLVLLRPFLATPKSVLRTYAEEHRVRFREDATNAHLDFQRNRVRHELLPLLRKHYQPAVERTVSRLLQIIQAEGDFVSELAGQWLRGTKNAAAPGIGRPPFAELPVALQRRCIYLELLSVGIEPDFTLVEELRMYPGKRWPGPASCGRSQFVSRDLAGRVTLSEQPASQFRALSRLLDLANKGGESVFDAVKIAWKLRPRRTGKLPLRRPGVEEFDALKVGHSVTLRHWQPGDRFQPIGMTSAVKVQDLFVNAKIPRLVRHKLVLATTTAGEIFWVEGLRIGERFKLQNSTKHVLRWKWQRA
jgi:tRNA(Ile)-lysidine synthase